ncbi:MAG: hypothetical protein AAGB26_11630 [Planctomycetota bacterium]
MKPTLISVFTLVMLASTVAIADNRPVKLSEIQDLHREGVQAHDILLKMNERGVGFALTSSAQRKLRSWGFTNVDIEHVRGIIAGKKYAPPQDVPRGEAGDDNNTANGEDHFPIGHGHHDDYAQIMDKVLSRSITTGKLGYRTQKTDRAMLHCSARMSREVMPLLKNIEKTLVAEFPAALANATQPKTTLLFIADNDRDFKRFFGVLMQSYDKQWPGYAKGIRITDETFWVLGNAILINGDAWRDKEKRQRIMAFGYGYMVISQIGDYRCPEGLATGFGNALETRVAGSPWVTLLPESGEEDNEIANWAAFIRDQLAANRLDTIEEVCLYSVPRMHHRHYATAWSLTEDLVKDPMAFYRFVDETASDVDTPHPKLLAETCDTELKVMHERWTKTIGGN